MITDYRVKLEIDSAGMGPEALECRTHANIGSDKHAFGFTGPDDYGRDDCGGPIFSGPKLYAFGLCTVIHNGPVEADVPHFYLETGDVIRVKDFIKRGLVRFYDFEATVTRGYPEFKAVGAFELGDGGYKPIGYERHEIGKEEFSDYLDKRSGYAKAG
jgi:hypothetical protein